MLQSHEQRKAERSRLFNIACNNAISYWSDKQNNDQVIYFQKLKSYNTNLI